MLTDNSGQIDDIFSQEELSYLKKYFSNLPGAFVHTDGNSFSSISQQHPLYSWFCKKVFNKIQQISDAKVQLLFGSYLNEKSPWTVHCDYYHKLIGEPYTVFLIPLSVNGDPNLVDKTHTIIFNEEDTYVDNTGVANRMWDTKLWNSKKTKKENNSMTFYEQHLSHVSVDELECLTIQKILKWKLGSVLYWDEKLLHCSDNFHKNNLTSKQAIVVHTYVV